MPSQYIPRNIAIPEGLQLRAMQGSDENFIYSSWIKSSTKDCKLFVHDLPYMHQTMQYIVSNVLKKATVVILCDADFSDHICAWMAVEKHNKRLVIHYMYVKEGFRGLGYSNALYQFASHDIPEEATIFVSSMSQRANKILLRKEINFHWRPWLLFNNESLQTMQEDMLRNEKQEVESSNV